LYIKIKQKFSLISHELGTSFLVLNTSYYVKIFPGLLIFKDLRSKDEFKIFLKFNGPVKNFTILQNLYNGDIEVNFHSKDGYLAYKILTEKNNVYLYFDRISIKDLEIDFKGLKKIFSKEKIKLPIKVISDLKPEEILFFGIHKKQDLELIKRRENLQEILPFIFLCSQFFPDLESVRPLREKCLLKEVENMIQKKQKQNLDEILLAVNKAHFFDAFVPRSNDEDYQNIIEDIDEKKVNPLAMLRKCFHTIKSMFIEYNLNEISILPCLPVIFYHGKALNLKTLIGSFDIEWSKKLLKKLIFKPIKDVSFKLVLQPQIKNFRMRSLKNEKGKTLKNKDFLSLQKNKIYFFDKFQK
jgi:hypothetical protein